VPECDVFTFPTGYEVFECIPVERPVFFIGGFLIAVDGWFRMFLWDEFDTFWV